MLRFGRPEPDYSRPMPAALSPLPQRTDEAFLKRVVEEEGRRGSELPFDSLTALATLRA
jgi:ATP-dependent DNA helicase RecG